MMNSRKILTVVLFVVVLVTAGATLAFAKTDLVVADQGARRNRGLVGSWMVTAIPDLQSGIPPMVSPGAFTKEGLIINSNETGHVSVGVWARLKHKWYAATFVGVEVFDGQFIQYKVRSEVEVDQNGEEFSGEFVNEISDADGNLLFTVNGTIHGERIHVELMGE